MKYFLFIDECGDQNLANFNAVFPLFTLCSIIISEKDYLEMVSKVIEMKHKYWNNQEVILHSRDIRKGEKDFGILLFDIQVKKSFYEDINFIMQNSRYTIVSCSIMKEPYIRKYGRFGNVYALSLSSIMEKTISFLDVQDKKNIELHVYAESRGKKEDTALLNFYNVVLDRGTYFVKSEKIKQYFKKFEFHKKKENIIGLQIADIAAYPIAKYILDKNAQNPAFNIIESKIYRQSGEQHGLKILP
ncbi:3-deoxy-D-manno-octulosonic acid transferase [Bacteroidia bacterium]|nr:3-deoxy-D-manno-octulosonic acid transferase [Bacteroidia bacterium]